MSLCVCEYCEKAFNSVGSPICPECSKLLDEAYTKARRYIYQNPKKASFADIIENTGISEKALSRLMSQGKIRLGGKKEGGMKCRVCGKEAEDGVLCNRCKEKLRSEKFFSQSSGKTSESSKKEGPGVLPLNQK